MDKNKFFKNKNKYYKCISGFGSISLGLKKAIVC